MSLGTNRLPNWYYSWANPGGFAEGMPPIQIHHSTTDEEVPFRFGQTLAEELKQTGQPYEFYPYAGDDPNLSGNLYTALARSVVWFDRYVKAAR